MATTTELALPDKDPAVISYRERAATFKSEALALAVDSDAAQAKATSLLGLASGIQREAEAKRTALVRPFNDHVKKINELFRQVIAPIVEGDRQLRMRVLDFVREKNRLAAAAAARAERERLASEALEREAVAAEQAGQNRVAGQLFEQAVQAETSATEAETVAGAVPVRTVVTPMGASTMKKVWTFKVSNAALVPREYLVVDERAIREAMRMGIREIPGVDIFQDDQLAVRG